jgi:endonuclease-3
MLSAQCTDARVNIVTKDLFVKYPSVQAFADADLKELEQDIHSTGFYHNKAKNIIACCKTLMEKYDGEVPSDIESLTSLAGVGRKTANVMLAVIFNKAAMAVDTHVFRVSERIGLTTNCTTPLATEKALCRNIPEDVIPLAHHWLILHGRYVCKARRPLCDECFLTDVCRHFLTNHKPDNNG